jgi:hypothetical protein
VIPLVDGGSHTADNLRVCCRQCNNRKSTFSEEEARKRAVERQQRDDNQRRMVSVQEQIKAALRELEQIEGWAEERATIEGHLTHAAKRAHELHQKMPVSRLY